MDFPERSATDDIGKRNIDAADIVGRVVRLHAEIRQDVQEDIADRRRRHEAARNILVVRRVAGAGNIVRRIKRNEHDIFGVVNRRNADERNDFVFNRLAVFIVGIDFFRGAGLAAHAVAGGLRRARRAVGDDVLHHFAHCRRRFLADDLAQNGPLVGFDDVAVAVEHLADNVRL